MEVNTTNLENFISPNSTLSTLLSPPPPVPVPVIVINNTNSSSAVVPGRVRVPKQYTCKFCHKFTADSKGILNNHLSRCCFKVLKNRSKSKNRDGLPMSDFESDLLAKFSLLSKKKPKSTTTRGESPLPPTLDLEGYTDSESDCYIFSSEKAGPSNSSSSFNSSFNNNRSFSHFKGPSPSSSSSSSSKSKTCQLISKEWQIIPPSPFPESSFLSPSSISPSPSPLGLSTFLLSPSIESPSGSSNNVHQPPIKLKLQIKPPVLAPQQCINNIRALQLPPVATVRPMSRRTTTTTETLSNKVPTINNTFKKYKNKRKRKGNSNYNGRSYECGIDSCSFTTVNLTNLKTHKRTHTGERPFNCSVCPYRGSTIYSIKVHESLKHKFGDKIFECRLCQFKPSSTTEKKWMELKFHLAEIHRLKPVDYYQLETSSRHKSKLKSKALSISNPVVNLVPTESVPIPLPLEVLLLELEPDGGPQAEVAKVGEGQLVDSIFRGDDTDTIMTEFERSAGLKLQSSGSFHQSQTIPAIGVTGSEVRDPPIFNWVAEPPVETDELFFVCGLCDLQIESLEDCYSHAVTHNANVNAS